MKNNNRLVTNSFCDDIQHLKSQDKEIIEVLLKSSNNQIERIVSNGIPTPTNEWYDQESTEFVMLVQGEATILYENNQTIELKQHDWQIIAPHCRHRVEKVSKDAVWLAIHLHEKKNKTCEI